MDDVMTCWSFTLDLTWMWLTSMTWQITNLRLAGTFFRFSLQVINLICRLLQWQFKLKSICDIYKAHFQSSLLMPHGATQNILKSMFKLHFKSSSHHYCWHRVLMRQVPWSGRLNVECLLTQPCVQDPCQTWLAGHWLETWLGGCWLQNWLAGC